MDEFPTKTGCKIFLDKDLANESQSFTYVAASLKLKAGLPFEKALASCLIHVNIEK
jgi:hypothetical protein